MPVQQETCRTAPCVTRSHVIETEEVRKRKQQISVRCGKFDDAKDTKRERPTARADR